MPTNKHWVHSPWFWHWDYNYITGSTQNRITECGRQLSSKGQSSLKGDKLPNSNPVWQGACQYHWHTWGGMKGWWGASPKKGLKRIQLHSILWFKFMQYSVWQRLTFAPLTWDCSNLWSEAGPINTQAFLNSLSSSPPTTTSPELRTQQINPTWNLCGPKSQIVITEPLWYSQVSF